jgi:hypothetical protein
LIHPKDLKTIGTMTLDRWTELSLQLTDLKVIKSPVATGDLFINLE